MIERGRASKGRRKNEQSHPAWAGDDDIWEYLEFLEDTIIAQDERLERLEEDLYAAFDRINRKPVTYEDKDDQRRN